MIHYLKEISEGFTGYGPITPKVFNALADYSLSMPTSPSPGRVWKSKHLNGWFLMWTELDLGDSNYIFTKNRKLLSFETEEVMPK